MKAWQLQAHIGGDPQRNRPGLCQVLFEPRKQLVERAQPPGKENVKVSRLRCSGPVTASEGSASRSKTTTCSKWSASARAAARPPIPAPTTTACLPTSFAVIACPHMTGIAWLYGFSADLVAEATRFEPETLRSQSRGFARRSKPETNSPSPEMPLTSIPNLRNPHEPCRLCSRSATGNALPAGPPSRREQQA